jgi:protein-S-isoprenylcysteine O-methyltransferase Ste14
MTVFKEYSRATPEIRRNFWRRMAQIVFFDLLMGACLFIPAGTVHWLYAWIYYILILLSHLSGLFWLSLDLIAERAGQKANTEKWDRVISSLAVFCFMSIYIVSGLDQRWQWSGDLGLGVHLLGVVVFLLGSALEMWAIISNRFFSSEVRIQFDRGHTVCSSGPYRFVRHPGYVGIILYFAASPLFLGSPWALLPAALLSFFMTLRTGLKTAR